MFDVFYYKPKNKNFIENLGEIEAPQNYIPLYKTFFELNETNYNKISFNHKYHIVNKDKVYEMNGAKIIPRDIFIKYSPVIDPIKYMIGKYDINDPKLRKLPTYNSTNTECLDKVLDSNNSSYIDGFFTYLTSQLLHHHGVAHGIDYYGSFMGIQKEFKMDVIEDLDYLEEHPFFKKNLHTLFVVDNPYGYSNNENSRSYKPRIEIDTTTTENDLFLELEIENIETVQTPELAAADADATPDTAAAAADTAATETETDELTITEIELIKCHEGGGGGSASNTSSLNTNTTLNDTDNDSEENDSIGGDDNTTDVTCDETKSGCSYSTIDENNKDDDEDDDKEVMATIYNFPVHLICLERCKDTMDELMLSGDLTLDEWRSAMFQIIATLIIYQKAFYLTHNDLHTNNIMYIETKEKYIYYQFEGKKYKVPTFGRIYKIIDYGRAIYTYKGKVFCSDSFEFSGDAATQYNFPPYYNDKKPIIEPNYSFDLCRLACSIYDCVIDEDENPDKMDEFQKLIVEWCMDDNGKSVLYKKTGEERYPSFKLYKMIARLVHKHTPFSQINRPFFKSYETAAISPKAKLCIDIDKIPCYA
jgi:hypothetical protein